MCLEGRTVLVNGHHVQAETSLQADGGEKLAMLFSQFCTFVNVTEPKIFQVYHLSCESAFILCECKGVSGLKKQMGFWKVMDAVTFSY